MGWQENKENQEVLKGEKDEREKGSARVGEK